MSDEPRHARRVHADKAHQGAIAPDIPPHKGKNIRRDITPMPRRIVYISVTERQASIYRHIGDTYVQRKIKSSNRQAIQKLFRFEPIVSACWEKMKKSCTEGVTFSLYPYI